MKRIFRDVVVAVSSLACMISASWPIFLLVRGHALMHAALPSLLAVGITGLVLRHLTKRGAVTLIGQACIAGLCTLGFLMARGTSLTPGNLSHLGHDANVIVSTSVAPLVDNTAVLMTFLVASLAIGVVIDVIGATSRVPMLVALPMAATFILATMALGQPLPARYFIAAAASWALLLWACSDSWEPSWRSASSWLTMTAAALVAALAISGLTPHRNSPALGRHGGTGGANTSVNFSSSLDLSKSLHSNNNAPVLIYKTNSPNPGPIRGTVSEHYTNGGWQADLDQAEKLTEHTRVSFDTPGYLPQVDSRMITFSANLDGIKAPLVPVPSPVVSADFGPDNRTFHVTKNSGVPWLNATPASYAVVSRELLANARPINGDSGAHDPSVTAADLDTSMLPSDAQQRVTSLAQAAAGKASGYFAKAVALQTYFRTDPQYSYSLTLAPTQVVNGKALDPLSNFLVTRKGYCTQFATAMVMAARSMGIPARIAIGFLPGTASHGSYVVRERDAHAWPELYFPGMGWTRFDPTPGSRSGSAPPYAPDPSSTGSTATTTSSAPPSASASSAPANTTTTAPKTPTSTVVPSTRHLAPLKHSSSFPWALLSVILIGLAVLILLIGLIPWAGSRERSRVTRAARDDVERDEGAWHAMTWRLTDLGIPLARSLSPRATAARFAADHPQASAELKDAVERASRSMEQARYSCAPTRTVQSATERVIRAAQQDAGGMNRLRALLMPKSGLAWCARRLRGRRFTRNR